MAAGTFGGLTETTEDHWMDVFRSDKFGREGDVDELKRALLCARLAMVDPGDQAAAWQLCEKLSSTRLAEFADIDPTNWPAWLRNVMDESAEGSLLRPRDSSFSPAMAWDLVTLFWAERSQDRAVSPRSPLPDSKTLVALLVDKRFDKDSKEYLEEGATAELKLELVPKGRGYIYPNPECLLFVKQDERFRGALNSARASVRELLGGELEDHDVRWTLTRHDGQPLSELTQESVGGAFALGLAALWARRSPNRALRKKLRALELSRVAVTAQLAQEAGAWRFAMVAELKEKLRAAADQPDQVEIVYVAQGQPRLAITSLHVVEVSTLDELVQQQHKRPKDGRGQFWSRQAVRIVASSLLAILLIATLVGVVYGIRLGREQQAKIEIDRWRRKSLVSMVPTRYSDPEIAKLLVKESDNPLGRVQYLIYHREYGAAQHELEEAAKKGLSHLERFHALAGDIYYFQNQFDGAVPHYEKAARVGPHNLSALTDLALALQQSKTGDVPAKIERALHMHRAIIAQLESVTEDRSSNEYRQKWACAHLNLARLLIDRPRYKYRSVPAGFRSLDASLTVFTPHSDEGPWTHVSWAYISSMVGVAFQNRLDGDRTNNLKRSIKYLTDGLRVYQRYNSETHASQYNLRHKIAFNTYMLGVAFAQFREGDRAANVDHALRLFHQADETLGDLARDYPAETARTERWRSFALIDKRTGNRAANLDEAIARLETALIVFDNQGESIDAAKTRIDLGRALIRRNRGTSPEGIETAIEYLWTAVDSSDGSRRMDRPSHSGKLPLVLTKNEFENEWAQGQNDLGTAYRERLVGDPAANLKVSEACYRGALSVRARTGRAEQLVTTLNGLGRTMLTIGDYDGDAAIEMAISLFEDALSLLPEGTPGHRDVGGDRSLLLPDRHQCRLSRAEAPEYLAETSANLGDALIALTAGDREANRKLAMSYYRMAERYYAATPYYSREYAAILRKVELLTGKEPPHGARVKAEPSSSPVQ
ncbi:MAG: hypothetical protein AABO58_07655 [Acidobacteriota bacterium]